MRSSILFLLFIVTSCSINHNSNCSNQDIDALIDNWHQAAADADLDLYFGLMSKNATYLGTDPDERWTKDEFYQFCTPYFKKGKTWDFKAYNRKIYFNKMNNTIWFDELLKTWMGVCRGSGVVIKENGKYKIAHYHLSVTVKNDRMKDFIKLKQD